MFEEGQLVKIPKSKMGIASKMDCRGSNFRALHSLEEEVVSDLLKQVQQKELPFSKLGAACKELKKLRLLKKEFVRQVGVETWDDATHLYLTFADEDKLRQKFLSLPFEKDMPAMVSYCQKAIR